MMNPERGKLIPVSGNNNTPDMENAVDVQFNPISLKVTLSNTLKENQRNGNSRAAQFVDKSSSSLAVELLFDTTYIDSSPNDTENAIEQGSDVRDQTKKIADRFIKPVESGDQMQAPSRCLFQWGSFEFVGIVENYEETLDFFSKEGRPLRAKVVLRLKEDRYQFRQRTDGVSAAQQDTPVLTPTGNADGDSPNQTQPPVPGGGSGPGNWRDTSLFNGIENPRLPSASLLAVPKISSGASLSVNAGIGVGVQSNASVSAAFNFGASASLGTKIEGAFGAGISAGAQVRAESTLSATARTSAGATLQGPAIKLDAGVGFD